MTAQNAALREEIEQRKAEEFRFKTKPGYLTAEEKDSAVLPDKVQAEGSAKVESAVEERTLVEQWSEDGSADIEQAVDEQAEK